MASSSTCEFDDMILGADEAVRISILVNELVTNALKHAFPDGRHGAHPRSLNAVRNDTELVVADNGVGMDGSGENHGTGLGIKAGRNLRQATRCTARNGLGH